MKITRQRVGTLLVSTAIVGLIPTGAFAQNSAVGAGSATPGNAPPTTEIVVTGTSLRGVAPAGAEEIKLDPVAIAASGATSTDQLLANVPQLATFGHLQTGNNGGVQETVNRINIRNLPNSASSSTLVLLDGHRIVGEGVRQSFPDPDVIPPALIQRVDVVPDGGSAVYGSDAVGGVVNFVTKRDFNGIEASIRQGFADSYRSTDLNFTAGKSWGTGSAYIGYNYAAHDPLYGSDRSYVKGIDYTTGLPTGLACSPANVVSGGNTYAVNGGNTLVLSNANLCDNTKSKQFYPKEVRHSVMAGFRQELSDSLEFDVKGYYSQRTDTNDGGPLQGTSTVTAANPNYISTGGGSTATQTVYNDFAPVGGREIVRTSLWAYGITPTLTWKIGHDWQMKAFYNYGQSQTSVNDPSVNNAALAADVSAGTINPYNIASSNSSALGQVLNYTNYGIGKDTISNAKVVFDGPLFRLPAGQVRVAVGGEYFHENFQGTAVLDTYQNVQTAPLNTASRNVKSGFAELNVPLISADNDIPLVYSLSLAAAERYDNYSDFGGNWAPSIGASWKPVRWVNLRARWNRAFQAPSLVTLSQGSSPQVSVYPGYIVGFVPLLLNTTPGAPAFNGGPVVAVGGTILPLQPQRARDYNLGFDISPPFVKGLNIHLTYWNIKYSGQVATPPLGYGQFYNIPSFAGSFQMLPTNAQITTYLLNRGISQAAINNALAQIPAGQTAYVIADIRARNLGITKTDGIDIKFDYSHDVSFGSVYASFNSSLTGSYYSAPDGFTYGSNLAGVDSSAFNFAAVAGATVGSNFRGQVTWNHLDGFNLSVPAQLGQTRIGAYNTFDLYLSYDLKQGHLPPIQLSLGVTNIFNTSPPVYYGVGAGGASEGAGYGNGSTVGRLFQLGASIKF